MLFIFTVYEENFITVTNVSLSRQSLLRKINLLSQTKKCRHEIDIDLFLIDSKILINSNNYNKSLYFKNVFFFYI